MRIDLGRAVNRSFPRGFEMNLKRKNLLTALFLAAAAIGFYVLALRQVIESVGHK